ncbi:ferrous iron transport protein A [bacterium]|nr:ferrous iron transport protein A [bacterium]
MLSMLKNGERGKVTEILSGSDLVKRLAAMGIVVGSCLSVVSNPNRGPLLVDSDGKRVAMGRGMAEKIAIEVV